MSLHQKTLSKLPNLKCRLPIRLKRPRSVSAELKAGATMSEKRITRYSPSLLESIQSSSQCDIQSGSKDDNGFGGDDGFADKLMASLPSQPRTCSMTRPASTSFVGAARSPLGSPASSDDGPDTPVESEAPSLDQCMWSDPRMMLWGDAAGEIARELGPPHVVSDEDRLDMFFMLNNQLSDFLEEPLPLPLVGRYDDRRQRDDGQDCSEAVAVASAAAPASAASAGCTRRDGAADGPLLTPLRSTTAY